MLGFAKGETFLDNVKKLKVRKFYQKKINVDW